MSLLPGTNLLNSLAGTRNYQVPKREVALDKVREYFVVNLQVFEEFENVKEKLHITDWAITNTTLEEVFLRIARDEEIKRKSKQEAEKGDH